MRITCPICKKGRNEDYYGPCAACRDDLRNWALQRATFRVILRIICGPPKD